MPTARGATKWRAADGSKPDGYLTPADAEERLAELLAASPREPRVSKQHRGKSFGDACAEWLRYVEFDRQRARSTLGDYSPVSDFVSAFWANWGLHVSAVDSGAIG